MCMASVTARTERHHLTSPNATHTHSLPAVVYIGLQGEYTEVNRKPPVVVYELNPQMADHKNAVQDAVGRTIQ